MDIIHNTVHIIHIAHYTNALNVTQSCTCLSYVQLLVLFSNSQQTNGILFLLFVLFAVAYYQWLTASCLLPVIYCQLLTAIRLMSVAYCQLFTAIRLLPIIYCHLLAATCLLLVAYCQLFTPLAYCHLLTASRSLSVAYCQLFTASCLLPVAYCQLFTATCILSVAYCQLFTATCLLLSVLDISITSTHKADVRSKNSIVAASCNMNKWKISYREHFIIVVTSQLGISWYSRTVLLTIISRTFSDPRTMI